jgi:hypothetical protein
MDAPQASGFLPMSLNTAKSPQSRGRAPRRPGADRKVELWHDPDMSTFRPPTPTQRRSIPGASRHRWARKIAFACGEFTALLLLGWSGCESDGISLQQNSDVSSATESSNASSSGSATSATSSSDCEYHHVNCKDDSECLSGYSCYHAEEFGDCLSSTIDCAWDESTQMCQCIQTDDCGGSKCVPTSEYPPKQCPTSPDHTCRLRIDCSGQQCGGLQPIDGAGCLRSACDPTHPCESGHFCYRAADWGGCASSHFDCEDKTTRCECASTDDCGGSYCVAQPAIEALCAGHATRETCEAANDGAQEEGRLGRCAWLQTHQVTTKGGSCDVAIESGACVTMRVEGSECAENAACGLSSRLYFRPDVEPEIGGSVLVNDAPCGQVPLGYALCAADSTSEICSCACGR